MRVGILTSRKQWFVPYARKLVRNIEDSKLYFDYKSIESLDVLFILSYHKIIPFEFLNINKHNIVIHASALPKGKGWAPMFWQILEGKDKIPFTMFEASSGIDDGDIYMQRNLILNGLELNQELRAKQAQIIIDMCLEFLKDYNIYSTPKKQIGEETFYSKRTFKDSELDTHKSIDEQFNLLRIVDNKSYPAFFIKNNKKYIIKIEEA